jgi:hypothetical protein
MKNAHERFGKLAYVRHTERTATNIRVLLDAFVGEERGKAHLISVVGGDTEIGALAAAFANGDPFTVIDPGGKETIVSLGDHPLCFSRIDHDRRSQATAAPPVELFTRTSRQASRRKTAAG